VRAISQQSARQLSTLRPSISSPIARLQASKPTLSRSFYQSRIARAEEDKREAEELKDETTAAAEEAEQAAEVAQQAADDAVVEAAASEAPESEPAVQEAQEVAEGESSIAAEAVEKAAVAASTAFSTGPPEPPQPSAAPQFPNDQDTGASTGTNFAAPAPSRILYIGNLFFEVTAAQLESEFGKFGTITNSRVVTDARGLSKGFGYIEFAQQSAADQAVRELDQKVYQGRRMAVQYHVRRERRAGPGPGRSDKASNPPSKTLFIGNMSYQMSDRDLNGEILLPNTFVVGLANLSDPQTCSVRSATYSTSVSLSTADLANREASPMPTSLTLMLRSARRSILRRRLSMAGS